MLNRLEVGKDGKTAYERNKGKTAKVFGSEFGEAVWWRRKPIGGALGKVERMGEDGIFLGTTGEGIIGDAKGGWRRVVGGGRRARKGLLGCSSRGQC